jgi:hypothetical protein
MKVTNRRVNALENVTIPRIEGILSYISRELDELEREDFTRLKKVQAAKEERIKEEQARKDEEAKIAKAEVRTDQKLKWLQCNGWMLRSATGHMTLMMFAFPEKFAGTILTHSCEPLAPPTRARSLQGIKPMKTVNEDIMSKFESLDGEEVLF